MLLLYFYVMLCVYVMRRMWATYVLFACTLRNVHVVFVQRMCVVYVCCMFCCNMLYTVVCYV